MADDLRDFVVNEEEDLFGDGGNQDEAFQDDAFVGGDGAGLGGVGGAEGGLDMGQEPGEQEEKPKNPFEQSLELINKDKKKKRAGGKFTASDAKTQAENLVKHMIKVQHDDKKALQEGSPAINKAQQVEKVYRLVNRSGFKEQFVIAGGVEWLKEWIRPIEGMGELAEPPLSVVEIVVKCLDTLGPTISKEEVRISGIGKEMRRILKDSKYPRDLRQRAQRLIGSWVSYVTGGPEKRSRAEAGSDDEAIEVDARGRKMPRSGDELDLALPGGDGQRTGGDGQRMKTEREKNLIWQPKGDDLKLIEERRKMRHAVMPMDKPVFDISSLPPSFAPAKRRAKEDPNSTTGKLSTQLQKISNPNKKAWKSTVGQVSIAGRDIVYKW
ncbi:unnamed protein product [Amoebophrya sp. A25]|nr:unnamed protein product [Amoebophrya sp. A25]|eukprot:GSA25T00018775001.1